MWMAILGIIHKILGWFKVKEERIALKEKTINTEKFQKAKEKVNEAKLKDANEKLVATVNSGDAKSKKAALDEIRRRLGQ